MYYFPFFVLSDLAKTWTPLPDREGATFQTRAPIAPWSRTDAALAVISAESRRYGYNLYGMYT